MKIPFTPIANLGLIATLGLMGLFTNPAYAATTGDGTSVIVANHGRMLSDLQTDVEALEEAREKAEASCRVSDAACDTQLTAVTDDLAAIKLIVDGLNTDVPAIQSYIWGDGDADSPAEGSIGYRIGTTENALYGFGPDCDSVTPCEDSLVWTVDRNSAILLTDYNGDGTPDGGLVVQMTNANELLYDGPGTLGLDSRVRSNTNRLDGKHGDMLLGVGAGLFARSGYDGPGDQFDVPSISVGLDLMAWWKSYDIGRPTFGALVTVTPMTGPGIGVMGAGTIDILHSGPLEIAVGAGFNYNELGGFDSDDPFSLRLTGVAIPVAFTYKLDANGDWNLNVMAIPAYGYEAGEFDTEGVNGSASFRFGFAYRL
ncbi:hypothetical protein HON52_05000 [Candidatus Uhrbacteria bacterium]|jgi:hypothetical protein|nr:hypothetical protein [Candidatus Uhrbacteria bacterium]